jgi:hypothetical protein
MMALVCVSLLISLLAVSAASAEELLPMPWWHVNVGARPTYLAPGSEATVMVTATNLGDAEVNGSGAPVTLTDTLPEGVEAVEAFYLDGYFIENGFEEGTCLAVGRMVMCSLDGSVRPYHRMEVFVKVKVEKSVQPGRALDAVSVSGGGAAALSVSYPLTISESPTPFGMETFEVIPENPDGSVDPQAGAHPFQLSTTIVFNAGAENEFAGVNGGGKLAQPALIKDVHVQLPPGLVGNPTPFPQCSEAQFEHEECPADTQVGMAVTTIGSPGYGTFPAGIYNLPPAPGEPARFAFEAEIVPVFLDTEVRNGKDYGVTVSSDNITELAELLSSQITIWGVPGDPRHDSSRGGEPDKVDTPLLAMPTACGNPSTEPFGASMEMDSWSSLGHPQQFGAPVSYKLHDQSDPSIALDGCNRLGFEPSISVAPDVPEASSPSGLSVTLHVPQEEVLTAKGLAESDVRQTTVTLPEGVKINPAGADGLEACTDVGEPGRPQGEIALHSVEPVLCPNASKIGTVSITTPLLPEALEGAVYLAAQNENPFGSLVAMYIVAQDPKAGVFVKLAGEVSLNEVTGQITAVFAQPPLPFEQATLHFFGGARGPLATPASCGAYTTTTSIAPWSGNPPATPSSTFNITSGPSGSACTSPLPFAPTLTAGTTSIQAGGFSPFTMTMSRTDGNQNLDSIQLKMPPGMLGTLSGTKLCGEPQADEGKCGPESLIGTTTVGVGVGGDPYTVTGGEVFITGPYEGAPYGLSIVNPAKAGPYDLGKVIVRAKIEVDPSTAALKITTDSTGPYRIPTIIDGIPLEIQHVNVTIDRPDFTFNPTDCSPLAITGSLQSSEGATDELSVPFQVTNCAVLAFKPQLSASTSGQASRANGASFDVKLSYPAGPYDANIARVKVELPKQLPSRLTTLQKACAAATFEANPASCPAASIIGHATAVTPVIPVPLTGPAYFVSHGGEAFPSLIIVLQGYGTTVDLVGSTFISKAGVTSSTFKTIPDVPVGTFELTLPEGPYSALAANVDLCTSKGLAMPTEFVGQNGALVKTSTKIAVTGCKTAIGVLRHTVKGRAAAITVSVPSAGELHASGAGLSGAVAKAGSAGTVTVRLALTAGEGRFLSHHPGRRLKVAVHLLFVPRHGGRLASRVTLLMR